MSRVLAVNRCVLILGITLYIGFLNQTFLARNGRRIKKDGNFFLYCYACWPKKNFLSEISHFLHVWRKYCISADIPGSSIPLPFSLMLIIALKRIRMEKLTYHAMGLVISQFKQFPYDEIHRMAFLIAIQASRKKPNIFVTFVFLVKKRCQLLLPSYSIEVV